MDKNNFCVRKKRVILYRFSKINNKNNSKHGKEI
jgi:hypothetical protein